MDHPIVREISHYPDDVVLNHETCDQFSDMVCFDSYILALQIKAAQLVVFDGKTKRLLARIAIPMGRLALRGICVDEKNCRVYVCTTMKLFCVSTHDIAVLRDPVVTKIEVKHLLLDKDDVFSGTMGVDPLSQHLYMVVAKGRGAGVNLQYAVARISQHDPRRVVWVDLKGYDFLQLCSMVQIDASMMAFTNNGVVLAIDAAASACVVQTIEHAYSLYKAMYDSAHSMLYVTNLKMDHMWRYSYTNQHFEHEDTCTMLTPSLFPTPICISMTRCKFDIFDNDAGLFREWSFARRAESCSALPLADDQVSFDPLPLPVVLTEEKEDDYRVFALTYDDICDFCDNVYDIDLSNTEYALDCVPSSTPIDEISSDFFERGRSSDSDEHISVMMPTESPYITLALNGKILPDFSFKTSDQEEENSIRRSGKRLKREFDDDEYVAPLVFKPFGSFLSLEGEDDYRTTHLVSVDFPCN